MIHAMAVGAARPRRGDEITLTIARLQTRMTERFEAGGVIDVIDRKHLYPTVRAAVQAYKSRDVETHAGAIGSP